MKDKRTSILYMTQGAVIAALYAALTLIFAPISFGAIQVRFSEALAILPMFTSAAIPGLFVGCLLVNIIGGAAIWDIIFGSIATLIGAVFGYALRKNRWLVPIPTVVSNTVIVPLVLKFGYGIDIPYLLLTLYIAVGEILSSYVLGEIFGSVLLRRSKHVFRTKTTD